MQRSNIQSLTQQNLGTRPNIQNKPDSKSLLTLRETRQTISRETSNLAEQPIAFSSSSNTPSNYGEKLYVKGLKKMQERERRAQKEKLDRELREWQDLTFHPQINPVSRFIGRPSDKRLEDQLIEKGKKSHDLIEK